MPYSITKGAGCPEGKPYAVVKKDGGKKVGCHASEADAKKQMAALYAQENTDGLQGAGVEGAPGAAAGAGTLRAREVMSAAEAIWSNSDDGKFQEAEVVIIRPGMSKNGRFYTSEAIQKAVSSGFWNGSKMFVDHGDIKMPMKRSLRDLVAGVTETWMGTEGEARGRVRFFDEKFAKFAQSAKDHMGVSVSMEFKGRRFRDPATHQLREQVDELVRNHSVDWVAFPAAGGQIAQFIAAESEDDVDWDALTPELVKEHAPTVFESIVATAAEDGGDDDGGDEPDDKTPPQEPPTPQGKATEGITEDRVRQIAQEAFDRGLKAAETRDSKIKETAAAVTTKVSQSGLPPKTQARISAQFAGQEEYVEATVQEAINDALAELKAIGFAVGPHVQGLGNSAPTSGTAADPGTLREQFPAMFAFESAMGIDWNTPADGDSAGKGN